MAQRRRAFDRALPGYEVLDVTPVRRFVEDEVEGRVPAASGGGAGKSMQGLGPRMTKE